MDAVLQKATTAPKSPLQNAKNPEQKVQRLLSDVLLPYPPHIEAAAAA
jgi:hypothetical protein